MKKNISIIFLTIILAVIVYKYVKIHETINVVKQDNFISTSGFEEMKLYKVTDGGFSVISEDRNFQFSFTYKSNGLRAFVVKDSFLNKSIGFNFSDEGILTHYLYEDDNYILKTNLLLIQPEILIQREEWFQGILTYYELLPDEITNINTKRVYVPAKNNP